MRVCATGRNGGKALKHCRVGNSRHHADEREAQSRQSGDRLDTLFAIRVRFLKTFMVTKDGQVQVIRFQMSGEIVGMDAISTGRHNSTVIALEDAEVCPIPFADLSTASWIASLACSISSFGS